VGRMPGMRDRARELRFSAATALGLLTLLLLPFEFFDVIAVALAAWVFWWMSTAPRGDLRRGAGMVPYAPVVFGGLAVVIATIVGRLLGRPGFVMATALMAAAVLTGFLRAATPVRSPEQ
jgi:hypothetical protein